MTKSIRTVFVLLTAIIILLAFCTQKNKQQDNVYQCKVVDIYGKYLHFSLDDIQQCMSSLSGNAYTTIFQDSTLNILKKWHDEFGIVVSLYVQGDFKVNRKYAQELIDNSDWLKFGYHGTTALRRKEDMHKFYKQVMDSVGSSAIIDQCPRIHYFHADHNTCMKLKELGCIGFLTCDDWSYNTAKRESNYYLSKKQNWILDENNRLYDTENGTWFIKTDFRLEHIGQRWGSAGKAIEYYSKELKQSKELIVFGHEWDFRDYLPQADSIFTWARDEGFEFAFPMNKQ